MSKARSTGNIGNIIKTSTTCVTVTDGTSDLLIMSGSGRVTIPGNLVVLGGISGSSAESASYSLSSSFATNANFLDGIDGTSFLQTGSFNTFSSSIDTTIKNKLNNDGVVSGSVQVDITSTTGYPTFSSSLSSSISSLSGSVATTTSGLSSSIGSLSSSVATTTSNLSSSIGSLSSSVAITTSGLASRIGSVETKTGSYATTGSNIFVGSQTITGSLYITTDLVVQGCSCLQNITASAVSIGTNTVVLNTATPAVRFAGISVQDSGSNAGVTGSIFWDGLCNKWVYSNPTGIGYSGGMLLSGPRTSTLGSESPLSCNYISKSGGGDHLYDSCIYDNGTTICINATNTIFSGGCVNIGNSPQDFTFNVATTCVGTNATIAQFYNSDYTSGTRGFIRVRNSVNAGGTTSAYIGQGVDQKTYFYNNDPSRAGDIVITNTGKVGIGTPSPISQLHIKTDVASASRPTTLATSATNSAVYITTICGSGAGIAFGQIGANTNYIQATYEDGSASTRLALNPYGNAVGIGTGNNSFSGQKLFIESANDQAGVTMYNNFDCNMWSLATGTDGINNKGFAIRDIINGATRLQIDNCGYIGIGTLSPAEPLSVSFAAHGLISQHRQSCGVGVGQNFYMKFNNVVGSAVSYAGIYSDIQSNTNGAHSGRMILQVANNGSLSSVVTIANTGISTFSNTICSPQFTGGFVCAVGGLSARGASTTWSTFNFFGDNPGGAGAQCKTVLAGSIIGCTGHGPQLRFSGAAPGGFIDIGQDCNAGFVIEASDTPSLNVTQTSRVGIQNTAPQGKLEVGIVNNNTTAGGHFFSSFQIPVNTWYTVFYSPSNGQWNAITEFTWTSAGDFNRSGAAYMRWAYEPGAATLGVVYTLFNNSQNATASFRKSGNEIQVYITGGAADYYVQVRIQGSQAS